MPFTTEQFFNVFRESLYAVGIIYVSSYINTNTMP
jgi:hypothetical protein